MQRIFLVLSIIITMRVTLVQSSIACTHPPSSYGSYSSGNLQPGWPITFTGILSHDNDGIIGIHRPKWQWDFHYQGPGTFVVEDETYSAYETYTFASAGTYTVAVVYWDDDGEKGNEWPFTCTVVENPKLLLTAADIVPLQQEWDSPTSLAFPLIDIYGALNPSKWTTPNVPDQTLAPPDLDREYAQWAKVFAFRYIVQQDIVDGNLAYGYLQKMGDYPNQTGNDYEPNNPNSWMTNGLALIDYCIAYDLLAGARYFETAFPTGVEAHKSVFKDTLTNRAASLYNRASKDRSVNEFLRDYLSLEWKSTNILGYTVKWFKPKIDDDVVNEARFHCEIGNERIITACALGVAAYLLGGHDNDWLTYARNDVEHFLLNRKIYPDQTISGNVFVAETKNVDGAFTEGIEYLNYAGQGFVPFFQSTKIHSQYTVDYASDPQFLKLLDWCYDVQLPTGEAPQLNSSGNRIPPIASIFAASAPNGQRYLWQLQQYTNAYASSTTDFPVEGFCMLRGQPGPVAASFDKMMSKTTQGQLIYRDVSPSPSKFLLISAKYDRARYTAETHGHAEAGSFIFADGNKLLVRQPGYSGADKSQDYEAANDNNTICPIFGNVERPDGTIRQLSLPPCTDAMINNTKNTSDFNYASEDFDLNSTYVDPSEIFTEDGLAALAYIDGFGSLQFAYAESYWMKSKADRNHLGICTRKFLMINDSYLVVRDDITRTYDAAYGSLQYACSHIHGNNGDNLPASSFSDGADISASGEATWTNDGGKTSVLRVNSAALGGKISGFSTINKATFRCASHSNVTNPTPKPNRGNVYHADFTTACGFVKDYGQILTVVQSDPNSQSRSSVTTKLNNDADNYLLYTVDGRGKTYGKYDVIFSQGTVGDYTINTPDLPYSIKTDASLLVISYDGTGFPNLSTAKIFSCNASYILCGSTLLTPSNAGDAQTSFSTSNLQYANNRGFLSSDPFSFSPNSQRRFVQTLVNGNNWLHQVYTSRGHVWIRHSTDGGNSWFFGNSGQPLDDGGGKCPSIAFTRQSHWGNNYIGVVWQQPNGPNYTIQGMLFNQIAAAASGVPYSVTTTGTTLFTEPCDPYSTNVNPNIIIDANSMMYAVTFERKSYWNSLQPGIYWLGGFLSDNGTQAFGLTGAVNGKVGQTDAGSTNAALSLSPHYNDANHVYADCIYQTGSGLKYLWLGLQNYSGLPVFSQSTPSAIGYASTVNINPSIVSFPNGEFAATWIDYDALVYKYSASPVLYYYNSGVQSCSINLGGENSGFAVWSQLNGGTWTNRSILFQNFSPISSTIQSLSTAGKFVQSVNSVTADVSNMYASSFYPFTFPYYFATSAQLGPINGPPWVQLNKGASDIALGRGCIISGEDASFGYSFEGLNVDGSNIGFVDAPDSLNYGKIDILNGVFISNPFLLKDDSKLVFTERSGFEDSASAARVLGKKGYIACRIDLIDNGTGKVIGSIKDVTLNSSNIQTVQRPSYSLNTKGLADRTVKIKVTIGTNLVEPIADDSLRALSASSNHHRGSVQPKIMLTKRFTGGNEISSLEKTSLTVLELDLPKTYDLSQNYPNPFNPTTTINYQIPQNGRVSIKIYDVLGREVRMLVDEDKPTGRYSVSFNASHLSSGVYFYSIRSGDYRAIKKMVLIK